MRIVNPVGKKGEDMAVEFLKHKSWKILERNYRKQYGEIDIIAIDKSKGKPVLVFVEVKTRTSNQFGTPLEAITRWKLQPMLKTIDLYIALHKNLPKAQRMDAVAITFDEHSKTEKIEHVENINF